MNIQPIGYVRTPFKEKFGIPRQACLIRNATAELNFLPPFNDARAFIGLNEFSHIWLQFGFHQHDQKDFKPQVRPPRLGGNNKLGVFATRSSFRPNALGLSLVQLLEVIQSHDTTRLIISCPDLLDNTPIYDIKPYIAYSDQATNSQSSYASTAPKQVLEVSFSSSAERKAQDLMTSSNNYNDLLNFIVEILSLDPRPAYKPGNDNRIYGTKLYDLDIKWVVKDGYVEVKDIQKV